MNVEIEIRDSSVSYKRQLWCFYYDTHNGLRLTSYHEQTRETARHKWKGPFWDHADERSYHSKLERPKSISTRALQLAHEEIARRVKAAPVYIGWYNKDHLQK